MSKAIVIGLDDSSPIAVHEGAPDAYPQLVVDGVAIVVHSEAQARRLMAQVVLWHAACAERELERAKAAEIAEGIATLTAGARPGSDLECGADGYCNLVTGREGVVTGCASVDRCVATHRVGDAT